MLTNKKNTDNDAACSHMPQDYSKQSHLPWLITSSRLRNGSLLQIIIRQQLPITITHKRHTLYPIRNHWKSVDGISHSCFISNLVENKSQAKFENKKENLYESIHVSCFKHKLNMKVKNDGVDFGCLNASSHVVCLKKSFVRKHDI